MRSKEAKGREGIGKYRMAQGWPKMMRGKYRIAAAPTRMKGGLYTFAVSFILNKDRLWY